MFSIPVGVLYRPSANKLKNLASKNYLGAAKLIAATDSRDAFTGFTGSKLAKGGGNQQLGVFGPDGKGAGSLSRAKTSAARIESTKDLTVAPLRRNNTSLPMRSNTIPTGGSLSRSLTMPTTPRGAQRNGAGLPTPPASDEQQPQAGIRDTSYGDGGLVDAYYSGGDRSPLPVLPPLPNLPSAFNGVAPTPEGQPIERVANWARENAAAPPLRRNLSASDNGSRLPRNPPGAMMRSNTLLTAARSGGGGGFGGSSRGGADLDDGYEGTVISEREMSKVRVKLRFKADTRGMVRRFRSSRRHLLTRCAFAQSISPDMMLEDFVERVRRKFESPNDLPMK